MSYLFSGCNSLKYIDISSFTKINNIFKGANFPGNCTIAINNMFNNTKVCNCQIVIKNN